MRAEREIAAIHRDTPLVVRASLPRTFLGLGIFAEAGLLASGIYLLMGDVKHPLEADPASMIAASVLLALATVLCCSNPVFAKRVLKHWPNMTKLETRSACWNPPFTAYGQSAASAAESGTGDGRRHSARSDVSKLDRPQDDRIGRLGWTTPAATWEGTAARG